jgi:hypothetical protein
MIVELMVDALSAVLLWGIRLSADPKAVGDCPNFASAAEQNGTVPFAETVFG